LYDLKKITILLSYRKIVYFLVNYVSIKDNLFFIENFCIFISFREHISHPNICFSRCSILSNISITSVYKTSILDKMHSIFFASFLSNEACVQYQGCKELARIWFKQNNRYTSFGQAAWKLHMRYKYAVGIRNVFTFLIMHLFACHY
jgi:hypothetical protein